ncbi:GH116 family glycosyl hydrolase [Embleya sp. AB8]|uniref:GH116 family glycosyl hydrolase n=1 Tax=Embleya sp. AB8 TaxID=3156304 RepID=UPI003C73C9BA
MRRPPFGSLRRPGHASRRSRTALLAVAALTATLGGTLQVPTAAAESAAAPAFTADFESGTLGNWRVAAGSFGNLVSNRATFHNRPTTPYNKQGTWYLSTLESPTDTPNDGYTGVVVSPDFTLSRPAVSMLVGGGNSAETYVAVCAYDPAAEYGCGAELARTQGENSETMRYRVLDLSAYVGKRVMIKVVDASTGGWGHITVDDVRANVAPMPLGGKAERPDAAGVNVGWTKVADRGIAGYNVYRSTEPGKGYQRLNRAPVTGSSYRDTTAAANTAYYYGVAAVDPNGTESGRNIAYARPYADLHATGSTVYKGDQLSGIRFPVGPLGAAGIVHDGTGARSQWWINNANGRLANGSWNNLPEDYTAGALPNSFFALRTEQAGKTPVVRALQTTGVGPFQGAKALEFTGEYPIATYRFQDSTLPVQVSERVENPMLPGDTQNSAIPTAIYRFTVKNTSDKPQKISLLATQQNAVGWNGYDAVGGAGQSTAPGYGNNKNTVDSGRTPGRGPWTSLHLGGAAGAGSMNLTAFAPDTTATAGWTDLASLHAGFTASGTLNGPRAAASPAADTTVNGALSVGLTLRPGQSAEVPIALSWNFPQATHYDGRTGEMYSNWWADADQVTHHVDANWDKLTAQTALYHDTLYGSNLPTYVLDRMTAATAVLHTPTVYWAKDGFFGAREGVGCCPGMPTHVFQYAQAQAWLWPEVGRLWTRQWLDNQQPDGRIPQRFNNGWDFTGSQAIDGQTGVILSAYRAHLTAKDNAWLVANWPRIKKAMDWVVTTYDPRHTGVMTGVGDTTLDGGQSTDSSWLGSLYLASLDASSKMAGITGDRAAASLYASMYNAGRVTQEKTLWNGRWYTENMRPGVAGYGNGVEIDMLLGQWWSTQLGLGDIYDSAHTDQAAKAIYDNNFKTDFLGGGSSTQPYSLTHENRNFVEDTGAGTVMLTWPDGDRPKQSVLYFDETMSGFEYSAAATLIQRGHVDEGLRMVKAVSDRYDGRARTPQTDPQLDFSVCALGNMSGNPFGDDECGKWYGRTLSSWSLLSALSGYTYDGPAGVLGFAPKYRPEDHRSFFTGAEGWGSLGQSRANHTQTDRVEVVSGKLQLKTLRLVTASPAKSVTVKVDGHPIHGARLRVDGTAATVTLPAMTTVPTGAKIEVRLGL